VAPRRVQPSDTATSETTVAAVPHAVVTAAPPTGGGLLPQHLEQPRPFTQDQSEVQLKVSAKISHRTCGLQKKALRTGIRPPLIFVWPVDGAVYCK